PSGQSWDRTSAQACKDCSACGIGGEWPVTDNQGFCYCTAGPGQFYNHIGATAAVQQCDSDQDGGIKKEESDELLLVTSTGNFDFTVLFNIQCLIPVFTSVELRNEWYLPPGNATAQTKTLSMIDIGATSDGVPMYEHSANDDGSNPDLLYRGGGRLDPRMVN